MLQKVVLKRGVRGQSWIWVKMSSRGCLTILLVVFYCLCATAAFKFPALEHIKSSVSDEAQSEAVSGLLKRLLGDRSEEFLVTVNRSLSNHSLDVCELRSGRNNRIVATGSSGVAVASGIYNYIKYFCNCHVSWSGDQLTLPRPLPKLTGVLRINTPHRLWWDWLVVVRVLKRIYACVCVFVFRYECVCVGMHT